MEKKKQILEYFYLGDDYKDIAKKVDVSESTIYRHIKSLGLKSCDRKKSHKSSFDLNEIGNKYNHLTIIGTEYSDMFRTWCAKCVCDCGRETLDTLRRLKKGQKKTCGKNGCEHHQNQLRINGTLGTTTGYEGILGSVWASWRLGAERRNIKFDVTIEEAWNKFIKQNKKCALSGIELVFRKGGNRIQTASLDRIDSTKPYTKNNSQWVHKEINRMKGSLSEEEFFVYCKKILEWNKN